MITLSQLITGGTTTMAALHQSRKNCYHSIFVVLMVTMALKYGLKLVDVCSRFSCVDHKYVQLWNGDRTTIDKMLESIMIHGVAIVFTLAMQLTMCTLYLTFWTGEAFVMSYVPGMGFIVFFMSFGAFTMCMVLDRVKKILFNSKDRWIWCFWLSWALWMGMVCAPMIGYCVYVVQFVHQVMAGDWVRREPFSSDFVNASRIVCHAAWWFVVVAIAELFIILKLDLDEGKMRSGIV